MPNIRRGFPGSSTAGGKQLSRGGDEDDDDELNDDSSVDEADDRGSGPGASGKQLRGPGSGKYLRASSAPDGDDNDDDDDSELDDDEDDDDHQQPVMRVVPRGGGKKFLHVPAPQGPEGDGEDSDDDGLEDDDDDELEDDDEEEPLDDAEPSHQPSGARLSSISRAPSGGKQLRQPEPEEAEAPPTVRIAPAPAVVSRGKQLVRPEPRGKQLRRPAPDETDQEPKADDTQPPPKVSIMASPSRGKQLRRMPESEEDADEDAVGQPSKVAPAPVIRGKQLRLAEPQTTEEKSDTAPPSKQPAAKPTPRGKQLRRAKDESEEESSEDEMELDDDEDEDEELEDDMEDDEEAADAPKSVTHRRGRPTRATAAKNKVIQEESDEQIGDDDISSDDDEIELDINNMEALIENEEDRKKLNALPELEREAILAERFDKLKAAQDMKKAMREAKMKEAASRTAGKKRKTLTSSKSSTKKAKKQGDADEELARALADRRESARNRDARQAKSKKAAALAALKREKQIQQQQQQSKMEESSDESLDFGDDEDDSDDDYEEGGVKPWQQKTSHLSRDVSMRPGKDKSDDDMDIDEDEVPMRGEKKSRKKSEGSAALREEVEATLEDYVKCTIPRRRLSRWCNEPFFEPAILECFVRLCIGEDESGEKVYRLCEIVDVKHGQKTYHFPVTDAKKEKPVSTDIILSLKFGKSTRDFPMYLVSDVPPNESDVQKYVVTQKNNRLEVLTKRRANKLKRSQDELVNNYTYTTQDIERNLEKRRMQGMSRANLALEQTRLALAVQAAKDCLKENDVQIKDIKSKLLEASGSEISELETALAESEKRVVTLSKQLQDRESEEKVFLDKLNRRKSKLSRRIQDQNWAKVNERALLANQRAALELAKEKKEDTTASGTKKVEFNPFARRRVKPKVLWDVGQDAEKDETKNEEEAKADERKESREEAPNDEPILVHEAKDKESLLRDIHQFSIDEVNMARPSSSGLSFGAKKKANPAGTRKGLSLQEYLERKTAGTL